MGTRFRFGANTILMFTAIAGLWGVVETRGAEWARQLRLLGVRELADVRATGLDGRRASLAADGTETLYLVFSPKCPISAKVAPAWKAMLDEPQMRGRRVVGLAWSDDRPVEIHTFLKTNHLDVPVYQVPPDELEAATGIRMSPAVLVTDRSGRAAFVGQGRRKSTEEGRDSVLHALGRGGLSMHR